MQQQGYIKSLDGVRGLAILLVLTFHSGLLHFGWFGVQLFFVLSGYLITGILWKEKTVKEPVSHKLKRFWIRRSLRIFPLYFIYLLGLGLTYLLVHFPSYYPTYAPYLFTYTVNYTRLHEGWQGNPLFTHLWSLSIEEQFYLFFPLLVFFIPARRLKYVLLAVIIITPFTRFLLYEYYAAKASAFVAADAVYWNTLSHLDAFFLGGMIPVLAPDKKPERAAKVFWACLLLAFLSGLINYLYSNGTANYFTDLGYDHVQTGNYAHVWRYTVLNLLFASLIWLLLQKPEGSFYRRLFENRILVRIGRVSYGMYILHWAVFVYVFARFYPLAHKWLEVLLFFPYLALVYGLAELSYHFIEARFLLWKEKLVPKKKPSLQAPVEE